MPIQPHIDRTPELIIVQQFQPIEILLNFETFWIREGQVHKLCMQNFCNFDPECRGSIGVLRSFEPCIII